MLYFNLDWTQFILWLPNKDLQGLILNALEFFIYATKRMLFDGKSVPAATNVLSPIDQELYMSRGMFANLLFAWPKTTHTTHTIHTTPPTTLYMKLP